MYDNCSFAHSSHKPQLCHCQQLRIVNLLAASSECGEFNSDY